MNEPLNKKIYTPEEYLEYEEKAEYKNEYFQGHIYPMFSGTHIHNIIAGNIQGTVHQILKRTPYEIFGSRMRIFIEANGL